MESITFGSQKHIDRHHTLSIYDWRNYCPISLVVVGNRRAPKYLLTETLAHVCVRSVPVTLANEGGAGQ